MCECGSQRREPCSPVKETQLESLALVGGANNNGCKRYELPEIFFCRMVSALGVGPALVNGDLVVGADCKTHPFNNPQINLSVSGAGSQALQQVTSGSLNHNIELDFDLSRLSVGPQIVNGSFVVGADNQLHQINFPVSPDWQGTSSGAGSAALVINPGGTQGHSPQFNFDLSRLAYAGDCAVPVKVIGSDNKSYDINAIIDHTVAFQLHTPVDPNAYLVALVDIPATPGWVEVESNSFQITNPSSCKPMNVLVDPRLVINVEWHDANQYGPGDATICYYALELRVNGGAWNYHSIEYVSVGATNDSPTTYEETSDLWETPLIITVPPGATWTVDYKQSYLVLGNVPIHNIDAWNASITVFGTT